ncbi:uncharacterized protein SAPINGB_P000741 [Magnusiomyces paraingens]|uniref:GH16 domain-containing protein n=1 Tax=Magnusiomyces paraingens TaxID=2606893 RepID=A0A5E8B3M9_9ASCO|nr:uncharacterized protein SAPINGB_P000741 [Saprochaete ingens]VVT45411.1 unnamed protein product [Saprochaete ingens]
MRTLTPQPPSGSSSSSSAAAPSSSQNPFADDDQASSISIPASPSNSRALIPPPPPPPHRANSIAASSNYTQDSEATGLPTNPFQDSDSASFASDYYYSGNNQPNSSSSISGLPSSGLGPASSAAGLPITAASSSSTTTQQYPPSGPFDDKNNNNNNNNNNMAIATSDRNLPLPQLALDSSSNNVSSVSSSSSASSSADFSNSNQQLLLNDPNSRSATYHHHNNNNQQYPASSYSDILPSQHHPHSSAALGATAAAAATAAAVGLGSGIGAGASTASGSTLTVPNSSLRQDSASTPLSGPSMSSAEFDRYPNRISSAAPSIASGSGAPLLIRDGYPVFHHHGHNADSSAPTLGSANSATAIGGPITGNMRNSFSNDSAASSFSDTESYGAGNPFVVNSDFSPFGGYPASSFPLHMEEKEADDYLHNPDPIYDAKYDRKCHMLDKRGWASLFALLFLILGAICIFVILPALTYTGATEEHRVITKEIEVLTNYEYNILGAIRTSLVDPDTPESAYNYTAMDGSSWDLVFSDEFNMEGRTFYDGDDQFWTAPDFHYAATQDLEWYDPDAVITENGTLVLKLDAFQNHNLYYRSGMVQSWNKFCFTQGRLEVSAKLPGNGSILGLWPGIWTLGNLVRPGYLATAEGVWPYSYNSCDAGITPNQSSTDGISYLKGQKLNACTCDGADHPNQGVGRGAQEIDALEGTVSSTLLAGVASQSLQIAPYDIWYYPDLNFIEVYNSTISQLNSWNGGPLQQAVSMATALNATWYELSSTPRYQTYGFEYLNDDSEGYIRWFVGSTPVFTLYAPALGPNGNIDQREISKEPMSIILNLGISTSWVYIDWPSLVWPSRMRIDYVRVWQPKDAINVGCDPDGYPTYDYIENHKDVYTNPNYTVWDDTVYEWPKNKLTGC